MVCSYCCKCKSSAHWMKRLRLCWKTMTSKVWMWSVMQKLDKGNSCVLVQHIIYEERLEFNQRSLVLRDDRARCCNYFFAWPK
jgi:hypothetical protein